MVDLEMYQQRHDESKGDLKLAKDINRKLGKQAVIRLEQLGAKIEVSNGVVDVVFDHNDDTKMMSAYDLLKKAEIEYHKVNGREVDSN